MAYDANDDGVFKGSNRVRLPARLRAANFAATVLAVLSGNPVKLQKLTTTQRDALTLGTGGEGTLVYDDTLNKVVLWNGTAWRNADGTALS